MNAGPPDSQPSRPDTADRWCVIGAGPCGLTAAKNLLQAGLPVEVIEREDDVGGNWYLGRPASSVFASTHLISSKRMTEYTDFPMPKSYPPFPSQAQVLAYLRDYARHFDLYRAITFNTSVVRAVRASNGGWEVTLSSGETRRYRGLIIANGHHWDPLLPKIPGTFAGETFHTHYYRSPEQLTGKRLLVIGAGNSGCDLAVEAAQYARSVAISMRRGYHFLPKFLLGKPIDACQDWLHRWRMPLWLRRRVSNWYVSIALGPPENYGLPKPDHQLFETHPIINSQLLYFVGHGRIAVRPAVEEFRGDEVRFADGKQEPFDVVVYATGYHVSFPFCDSSEILDQTGRPRLFLNVFPAHAADLFVIGLIQPNSGIWGLADLQAQLLARYLVAREASIGSVAWFDRLSSGGHEDLSGGIRYVASPRHALEIEYFSYRQRLQKLIARFPKQPSFHKLRPQP